MPRYFEDLRTTLVEYRAAAPLVRQRLLTNAKELVEQLPPTTVNSKEEAIRVYQTMARTTALIKHAHALGRTSKTIPISVEPHSLITYEGIFLDNQGRASFVIEDSPEGSAIIEKKAILEALLDDYLREQHASLYETASNHFNKINMNDFRATLTACIQPDQFNSLPKQFREQFYAIIAGSFTQSLMLKKLIEHIKDSTGKLQGDKPLKLKLLMELRCLIQQRTFKPTTLYSEAISFIENNSQIITIDNLNDAQMDNSRAITHGLFIDKASLSDWFSKKSIQETPLKVAERYKAPAPALYPFEALVSYPEHSTSRLLLLTAIQIERLNAPTLDWKRVFNQDAMAERYNALRILLIQDSSKTLTIERTTSQKRASDLQQLINDLRGLLLDDYLNKELKDLLQSLIVEVEKDAVSAPTDETLLTALKLTEKMFNKKTPFTSEDNRAYEEHATRMKGHASPQLRLIAGILLVLGTAALALGLVSIISPTITVISTGTLLAASTFCFFKSQATGSSKAMHELGRAKSTFDRADEIEPSDKSKPF